MRRSAQIATWLVVACLWGAPGAARDPAPIPERRMSYAEGMDLQGRDLAQIFDTTLPGCEAACLADSSCEAVTFNARNGSCFPKAAITGMTPYPGAVSGVVLPAAPGMVARGAERAADLGFLDPQDLRAALDLARAMGRRHLTGFADPQAVATDLAAARIAGDTARAQVLDGVLTVLTDGSESWSDYAVLEAAREDGDMGIALSAAVNGYLRAPGAAAQAESLAVMAQVLERTGRTRAMIRALERAAALSPRDDIAAALAEAQGKYGFRITEHLVQSDAAIPRICAVFSEDLVRGMDYGSFVQLPSPGLSVEPEANQICVAGLDRGARHQVTFRKGLPAADGTPLLRDVAVTAYIRDRSPVASFPGRAYILPRGADSGLPVQVVNAETLDLRLLRVSDRNLVAAMRADWFATALSQWSQSRFADDLAEEVWTGSASVGMELNREVTTRLPVQEVTGPLGPGVYALIAAVPGADPDMTPPAMQWFVISDLGMTTFSGTDGLTVAVRRLSDAAPVAGAGVALVNRANTVIARAETDAAGMVRFDAALAAGRDNAAPALVSVAQGDDMSFLSLADPEFDLSDRGVAGLPPAPPIDVFLATDRGAYRAGETIHATILARDSRGAALSGLPMTAVLMRPDGVEYARLLAPESGAGGHALSFALAGGVPRGTWRLDVFVDPKAPALASSRVLVEDFLPERIDFGLTLPEGVLAADAVPQIDLSARWLFGAPGAGLDYEGSVRLRPADSLPGAEGYRFGRYDEETAPAYAAIPPGQTDAGGAAAIAAALPEAARLAARPMVADFTLRLREGSGRPVERAVSRVVMPDAPVIGLRPLFDGGLPEGAEARFDVVALGAGAQPVPATLHWRVNRVETRYQWYAIDGYWNWEPVTRRERVAEGTLAVDGSGPGGITAPTGWGRYEIVVENDQGAVSSLGFDAGWFAAADVAASPDRLDLSLDRAAYRAGETARLRIVAPAEGVALVSVLSNRVIALQSVAVKAGENTVDLPVTDEWGAGAYVTASVIRGVAAAQDRVPARAMGLVHAPVDPGPRRLTAAFDMPGTADPRAALPVALRVTGSTPGETVWATIAAVDVGILNLTGFRAPDPQGHYFGQRRLGVGLRDIYGRLIDGRSGVPGAIRSGGDAGGVSMQSPPPTEELVAYFSGPVTVDADGVARTVFDMPAFNGTVRLSAVVWSGTGVGQAATDILIRDPVVVTAALPRFLAPGDRSRLLLDITHATGPAGEIALSVTGTGVDLGPVPAAIDLAEQGNARVEIPVAATATGLAGVTVALTLPDGRRLEKHLALPVQNGDPAMSRVSRFDLGPGQTFTLDRAVFDGLRPGSGRAIVAAGPVARFDAAGVLAALDSYPYGCTEQVTSQAMPLLYLSSVAAALDRGTPADLSARIDAAIVRVLTNQDASGGFGLWRAGSGDGWLDAYVTDFLSRARQAGHGVPDAAFRNALDNLRNQVNYAPDFDRGSNGGGVVLAYQLMVLAREGAAAIGDLRYYADVKGDDFATPMAAAQLGAALAAYGDPVRADAMFARAGRMMSAEDTADAVWRTDYGSDLRDRAAVLALAQEAGSTAIDAAAVGASVAQRLGGVRLSTQEAVWTLMAARAAIDRPGAGALLINGQRPDGPLIAVMDAAAADRAVAITNPGDGTETLTLTTIGVPETPEPAGGNGWRITRSYYTIDGEAVDIARVAQGTRLVAVLEITPLGPQEARLIIDDPLPAGFEIDNPNLIRGGDLAGLDWLETLADPQMAEFRQDRFTAAVDWRDDTAFRLAYILRAVSPGTFHHPAASVEDMYRPAMRGQSDPGRVVVE